MLNLFRKSYSGLSRETWILAFVTLVNRSGMMVLPFLSIYLTSSLKFSVVQAGIVSSFFGVGSMIGSYSGGKLSDRFGYFSVQLFSLIAGGISCVCMAWVTSFTGFCVGMVVTSMLLDMLRPSMSAAVSAFSKPESRTRSFSLIRMAINLGAGIGPAIAGILAGYSFHLIFLADGLTSVLAGFVLYLYFHLRIRKTSFRRREKIRSVSPMKRKSFVIFIMLCMLYAIVFFQLFCTVPLYYDLVYHLPKQSTGYLIALNGIIVFVFEMMLVFRLENSVHPKKIIMTGILMAGFGLALMNIFNSPWILIISMIILSFSEILAMPFMMTVAVSGADENNRGTYTGIYSTAWSAAFIIAPVSGTFIVTNYGFASLWWIMCVVATITAAGIWFAVPHVYKMSENPE